MQTISGRKFWPLDPRPEDFYIEDIAHALSNVCRFAGHCKSFYSVAQHSVYVSQDCDQQYALEGLLHDASEAYIGDMVRPLKRSMPEFNAVEERIECALAIRFGLTHPWPDTIKQADASMLLAEARDIMSIPPEPWNDPIVWGVQPAKRRIVPSGPTAAKSLFLTRYAEIMRSRPT